MIHSKNLGKVFDGTHFFNEDDNHNLVVGPFKIVGYTVRTATRINSALSDRPEFGRANDPFCLLFGVDMRDDDTVDAAIKSPSNNPRLIGIHTQHRSHAPEVAGARHIVNLVPRYGTVLA